jgi:uncharacterized protein
MFVPLAAAATITLSPMTVTGEHPAPTPPPQTPGAPPLVRFYPEHAQTLGITGEATLRCRLKVADLTLTDCRVTKEVPKGEGFGDKARELVSTDYHFPASAIKAIQDAGEEPEGAEAELAWHFRIREGGTPASPLGEARAAYERKEYVEALRIVRPLAEGGDAIAQRDVGLLYYNGQGVARDYEQAAFWYRKAADQGEDVAENALGVLYINGQGVPKDYALAFAWLSKATAQGMIQAYVNLGSLYENGNGVPQDYAQAASWYRKAAAAGVPKGESLLGQLYNNGEGLPEDYGQAAAWYAKAADQGDAAAQFNLGAMYGSGRGVPRDIVKAYMWLSLAASRVDDTDPGLSDRIAKALAFVSTQMTPSQVAKAQQLARDWAPVGSTK